LYKPSIYEKLFLISFIAIIACYGCGKVDPIKAKALVVSLIQKIDSGKYNETSAYYTDEFNAGESLDARIEKYKALKDALGNVVSIQCISEKDTTDPNDRPIIQLMYRVKHTKLTSLEAYSVVSQNGDYKIEEQDVEKQ
jgi:hypothetical protein